MAEKKKYVYKSKKEKAYEASLNDIKPKENNKPVPEKRRHITLKHPEDNAININIYESYPDTENNT